MVPFASIAAIAWIAVQWLCDVLVLLVVGALLAETSPAPLSSGGGGGGAHHSRSAGKRCESDVQVRCDYSRHKRFRF